MKKKIQETIFYLLKEDILMLAFVCDPVTWIALIKFIFFLAFILIEHSIRDDCNFCAMDWKIVSVGFFI